MYNDLFSAGDPEALRLYNLKDVVGSDYITTWCIGCYGCVPCDILVNRCCGSSVTKHIFFKCNLTIKLDSIFATSDPEVSLMGSVIGIEKL